MEELASCYHFCDIKRLHANTQRNNKILKGLWNINVNSCYICLLLIELLPRMWALRRIICQCKTSNGPIYWLLQAVEFQQSLINLFRSESLETQWGELHSRGNISSFLKTRKSIFVLTLFGCNGEYIVVRAWRRRDGVYCFAWMAPLTCVLKETTAGVITRFAFLLVAKHIFCCAPPINVNLKDASKRLLLAEDGSDFPLFFLCFFGLKILTVCRKKFIQVSDFSFA